MHHAVATLLSAYDRGMYTGGEVVRELLELAADTPAAELAAGLPPEWLASLRQSCDSQSPGSSQGNTVWIASFCGESLQDWERRQQESKDRWHAGLLAWQAHLATAQDRRGRT